MLHSSSLPISSEGPRSLHPLTSPLEHPSPPDLLLQPPHHPSNVGGQQNNIQGVTVTGSPLPALSSCHCLQPRLPLWLLHSIKRTHTRLHGCPLPPPPLPLELCSALAPIMGETLWRPGRTHQSQQWLGKMLRQIPHRIRCNRL